MEIYAAADPLQIGAEELLNDTRAEMERLLAQCEERTEEELMREVHVAFQFDLCRRCQQALLRNPLALPQ